MLRRLVLIARCQGQTFTRARETLSQFGVFIFGHWRRYCQAHLAANSCVFKSFTKTVLPPF